MRKYFIDPSLTQYKGQIHIHTTLSDGALSPDKSLEKYKKAGYDFIAFTDHYVLSESGNFGGMLTLGGIELDRNYFEDNHRVAYHIVGIGVDGKKFAMPQRSVPEQFLIDSLKEAGAFVIVAHPSWSVMSAEELFKLKNYDGIEIMNHVSEVRHLSGDSSHQIDKLMTMGITKTLLSSDDVHYYAEDFAGSATVAVCETLDQESVIKALYDGSSYATMGEGSPVIKSLYAENGELFVECENALKAYFISDTFYVPRWRFFESDGVNTASYTPCATDTHVRVGLVSKSGKKAWSNFIKVEDII